MVLHPWKLVQQQQTTVEQATLTSTASTEVQTLGPTLLSTVVLTKMQQTGELCLLTNWMMYSKECGNLVATYNGVPIIPSKDVEKDGISRMYFLDTDYLYFSTAIPTQYFESGIETGDPFAINRLGQEGLYRTMGEVWTTFFRAQGSIRDLQ